MDTLGIEPRASRMLSGCDTTTPCAHTSMTNIMHIWAIMRHVVSREKSLLWLLSPRYAAY